MSHPKDLERHPTLEEPKSPLVLDSKARIGARDDAMPDFMAIEYHLIFTRVPACVVSE